MWINYFLNFKLHVFLIEKLSIMNAILTKRKWSFKLSVLKHKIPKQIKTILSFITNIVQFQGIQTKK